MFKRLKKDPEVEQIKKRIALISNDMRQAAIEDNIEKYGALETEKRFLQDRLEILEESKPISANDNELEAVQIYNESIAAFNRSYKDIEKKYNKALFVFLEAFREYIKAENEANKAKDSLRKALSWEKWSEYNKLQPETIPDTATRQIIRMFVDSGVIDEIEADNMKTVCNGAYVEDIKYLIGPA